MTRSQLIFIAAAGSAALLIGALLFQWAGYAPCQLCMWQRWPHLAAVIVGALAFLLPARIWPWLGALAALATAGVAAFHTGVERKWWDGLQSCSGDAGGLTGDLLSTDAVKVIACDEIAWQMFGLSMANLNLIASLVLAAIWVAAARKA